MPAFRAVRPLYWVATTFLLLGCGHEDTAADPAPVKHVVLVRVRGHNVTALDAEMLTQSFLQQDRVNLENSGLGAYDQYGSALQAGMVKEYPIGSFGPNDLIETTIAFRRVTPTSPEQPSSTTRLHVELVVDGEVVQETELNARAGGKGVRYDPHLKGTIHVDTSTL